MAEQNDPKQTPPPGKVGETEKQIDRDVEQTFPASDPPAHTGITGPSDKPRGA